MRMWSLRKYSILLLLLGLSILGPPGHVCAEPDEPPRGAESGGQQLSGSVLQGDGNMTAEQAISLPGEGEVLMMDRLRMGVLLSVSWILLSVGLVLVGLTLRKTYVWMRAVQRARVPPTRYFNLQVQVRDRNGELGLYNFDYYPVAVAASGNPDLLLPDVENSKARFRIDYCQGQAHLQSDTAIIVNGVPRQHKPLKQDDRIIFGPYRLMFKDASIREQAPPTPERPVFVWQFPIVALLLTLAVLFRQAGVSPEDRMLLAKAEEIQKTELHRDNQLEMIAEGGRESGRQVESPAAGEQSLQLPAIGRKLRRLFGRPVLAFATAVRDRGIAESTAPEPPAGVIETPEGEPAERPVAPPGAPAPVPSSAPVVRILPAPAPAPAAIVRQPPPLPAEEREPGDREPKSPQLPPAIIARVDASSSPAAPARKGSLPDAQNDRSSTTRQSLPAREPIPASVPPAETTAEVPPPPVAETSAVKNEVAEHSQLRASRQPPVLQASVLGSVAPPSLRNNGIDPLEGLSFVKARPTPEIGRVKVRVIPPGRSPEYFKADILFIHAHPDDESIDFGSLMAMSSRSGRRIVTLLFTDGESGLDLYPQRKVGDIYPARALSGGALSQVRVVEATRALSILGSEMYIRWGLENRPYNTKADEVPPEEVIRGWGGEDLLVERLIEVLEGFRPDIVVSPDRHSEAYEHFEHEAVGQLVQAALQRLRERGESFVKGHLVSIDPYQVDRYDGVANVEAQSLDGESGLAYRSIQAMALKEHVTQRDASVIGVNRLSHLAEEYYKALFWDLELPLQGYLK